MGRTIRSLPAILAIATFILVSIFALIDVALTLSPSWHSIGRLIGITGFILLSLLIISGESARFFDRYFGIDRIIKFQRKLSLVTVTVLIFHPIFFILGNSSMVRFLVPNPAFPTIAAGTVALYLLVAIGTASYFYKLISNRIWQVIHIFVYILFLQALFHAFNTGSSAGRLSMRILYTTALIMFIFAVIFRTIYKIQNYKKRYVIKEVQEETDDTFTLKIAPIIPHKAGQFNFLRLDKNRLFARHPFTVSSAPGNKTMDFTIKREGRFTQAAEQLKPGDNITVEGPFGTFTLDDSKKDVVFIAGGVGITPFMSIIQDRLNQGSNRKITLFYASRYKKSTIFLLRLKAIKEKWFKLVLMLSKDEKVDPPDVKGRISTEIISDNCSVTESIFYICGPEGLKKSTIKMLRDMGVKKRDIIVEDFFW